MGRDDVYPVMMSVATALHCTAASTVFSTPDDGRRKHPKHVE
jgi:hypothetical protein